MALVSRTLSPPCSLLYCPLGSCPLPAFLSPPPQGMLLLLLQPHPSLHQDQALYGAHRRKAVQKAWLDLGHSQLA